MDAKQFNRAMGFIIRAHRVARGMTQVGLGLALGVSFQQVQKYERGVNGLSAHYLPKVAAVFGITVAELCDQAGIEAQSNASPAAEDAFMAAHYVRQMSEPVRAALLPYLQRIVYAKGKAA